MKKIDSYVLRELMTPFLIGTVGVVLMFQANFLIFQLKTFSVSNVPLAATMQVILYSTPSFLRMTLPIGTSLAAALAMSRLARESELTAMRIAGVPILRICLPVFIFGIFVSGLNFYISEQVMPAAQVKARKLMQQVGLVGAMPEFKNNVAVNLAKYSANLGTVARTGESTLRLTDVFLFERPDADVLQVIHARSGEYADGNWVFMDTYLWRFQGENLVEAHSSKPVSINDPITVGDFFTTQLDDEKNAAELRDAIRQRKQQKVDSTQAEILYHSRFSVPASSLVFALVAPIFAILFARSGGFMGVLISIFIVFLYYNCYIISTDILGRNGVVSPFVAAWLPNFLFLAMSLVAIRRLE